MTCVSNIEVTTNYVPRDIIEAWELTPKERKEYDTLDWEAIEDGRDSAQFFRYHDELYYLNDFQVVSETIKFAGWEGYISDTYFSGILVKYVDDYERVIVGRFYVRG